MAPLAGRDESLPRILRRMMAGTVPQMARLTRRGRLEHRAAALAEARLFPDEARHDLTYVGYLAQHNLKTSGVQAIR
jgi:hypothetical protein